MPLTKVRRRQWVLGSLAALFVIAFLIAGQVIASQHHSGIPAVSTAETTVQPVTKVDLSGNWVSKGDGSAKFTAEIRDGKIMIKMVNDGQAMSYYYGTFETPITSNEINSVAIKDKYMVWSTSDTKSFLYQNQSLIFTYQGMGLEAAIELARE